MDGDEARARVKVLREQQEAIRRKIARIEVHKRALEAGLLTIDAKIRRFLENLDREKHDEKGAVSDGIDTGRAVW